MRCIRTTVVACCALLWATRAVAQRVEFPTPSQPIDAASPYSVAPSPYSVPSGVPTYAAPGAAPPTYSAAAVGPPPSFDPYSIGGPASPAPPPVTYTPPPTTYTAPGAAPVSGVPVYPPTPTPPPLQQTNPFQAQPAPYDITPNGTEYWQKTQRFLQELSAEYTFLHGRQSSPYQFGLSRLELSSTFTFPMLGDVQTPLLVTPGFAFNWLDGPSAPGPPPPDLPPRVYDAYLDTAWFPHPSQWLGLELGFRIGVYSDFDHVDTDSIRLMGRGAADIAIAPDMDVVLGAAYLDRLDVKILPVVGIYYRPSPDWDIYAVFPNPKIRKFLAAIGTTKWWGYGAGEYGGGSWSVDRSIGGDRFDYNDIRIFGGLEWETQTQVRGHVEIGYVFDREIVFDSQLPPDFKPDPTFMLRAGINF
ncbi:MAG TPA: hypothetical protein VH107_10230 [Lacipirellulaceae bacterium]|nr:hypothetical protein [Lacipirellulaceae bacterium]